MAIGVKSYLAPYAQMTHRGDDILAINISFGGKEMDSIAITASQACQDFEAISKYFFH